MMSPKERDAWERSMERPLTDYEIRHGVSRWRTWWLCPRCSLIVAPYEPHRHLR